MFIAFTLTNMSIFQDIPFRFPSTMMKVDIMVIVRVYIMPRFSRFRDKCTTCNIKDLIVTHDMIHNP